MNKKQLIVAWGIVIGFVVSFIMPLVANSETKIEETVEQFSIDIKEFSKKEENKKIKKYYDSVVEALGELYGGFQLMAEDVGGYGRMAGIKSKAQAIFKSNSYSKKFERDLKKNNTLNDFNSLARIL